MSITIEMRPDIEGRLREKASVAGKNPSQYAAEILQNVLSIDNVLASPSASESALAAMLNQTPEEKAAMHQRARTLIIPGRPLPDGKSLEDVIAGKWPGDETDEQINAALEALS